MKTQTQYNYIKIMSIAIIIICVGEFATMFIFGAFYPGYNQLKDTMSALGASKSPVSFEMSSWWILMGTFFILFGITFRKAFDKNLSYVKIASWIFIFYGIGEGIGSGAFKADHILNGYTTSLIIHDTVGGIGVLGILALPLIMMRIIPKEDNRSFHRLSKVIFVAGISMISLFLFRYLPDKNNFFLIYKGLWQRLFMLNTYVYITVIAIIMIKENQNTVQEHR